MGRIKCPHCGKEIIVGSATFSMFMPVSFSVGLHKRAHREGVSVSSLVNRAILALKKTDLIPLSPVSNLSVGYNITAEALDHAKSISEARKIGVRAIIRGAVALAYFDK